MYINKLISVFLIILGIGLFILVITSCSQAATAATPTPVATKVAAGPTAVGKNKVNVSESTRLYYGTQNNEYIRKISDGSTTCYFRNLGTANAVLSCK